MADTTYALTNAAFRQAGQFADGQINSLNGYRQWVGRDSRIEFKATGTACTMSIVAVATQPTLRVSVDGGGFSNLTLGSAGVRADVTLFTGLSDAQHTVVVEHSSGTQANAAIEIANAITVTGASPAIAAPDGYGNQYRAAEYPLAAYSRYEGAIRPATNGGYVNILRFDTPNSAIRFTGNPTSIKAWINNSFKYRVFQDGTALASSATATGGGSGRYGWDTIASSLSGTHEYEIVASPQVTSTAYNLYEIMLIGGDLTSRPTARKRLMVIGDSITAGNGTSDSTLAFGELVARATNRQVFNTGLSSSRLTTFQSFGTLSMGQRLSEYFHFRACENVDEIIILYGHNDAVNQAALADFNREYTRLVTDLMAAFPDANIRCSAILPTTASITPITRADYIAEIASVVSTINDANVTHVTMETTDMSPTYNATAGQDTTDGVHPNSGGYTKIADRYEALLSTAADVQDATVTNYIIPSIRRTM